MVLEAGAKYSFNDDGSEMSIMDVTKLDEGDYTCIAKNKAGESNQELSLRVFGTDGADNNIQCLGESLRATSGYFHT